MKSFLAAASAAACMSSVQALAEAAPFVLASQGRARAVVVPYNNDTNGVGYVANELADYLGRLAGAEFMVAEKPVPGYRTILVGAPYQATKPQELCIRVKDANTLEVTGDGPRGTAYAVYDLLETFGLVFATHDYTYVPSVRELSLAGDYNKVDAPCMTWRDTWCEMGYWHFDHMMHLRLDPPAGDPRWAWFGKKERPTIGQTVCTRYVPRKKFAETRPEWYAYVHHTKQRNFHWVCVSNEEMLRELYAEIDAELAANPKLHQIAVGVDDGAAFCECEKCLALIAKHPDPDGSAIQAIQYVILANKVGEHFAKKYPHVRFNFLGYGERLPGNPAVMLGPNVGGGVAELWRNHGLPVNLNERGAYSLGNLARMSNPKNGPYVWDYLANFRDYCLPFPNHRIFAQTARYYKACGVEGVSSQNQFSTIVGDMAAMNLWLFGKLLWNPDADIDALTDQYVYAAFGPRGGRAIKEYLDLLEHARLRQRWTWFGCYVGDSSHYLTAEDCVKILRALDNAVAGTRGGHTENKNNVLARRARIAGLDMALQRYNDMIEPAQKLGYKLPPREDLLRLWKSSLQDAFDRGACGEIGEGQGMQNYEKRFLGSFESPAEPTKYPRRSAVISVPAAKMTGGTRMTRQKDPDGTEYCQFKVNLAGELENTWMNPAFAEIGYTIDDADTGWWYVFATVRISSTVALDEAAAYAGIYQPWYINDFKCANIQEIANQTIQARKGDLRWKTICLGKRRLYKGSRVWVMNGILHQTDFCDVKNIALVDPALIETAVAADPAAPKGKDGAPARGRSAIVACDKFDKARNVRIQEDKIDNFTYARLASFDNNAPVHSISWTVTPELAGEWDVLLDIRSGASVALDQNAALAYVTDGANGAERDALREDNRWPVTGSVGDESWQFVNLGRASLAPGVRIVLEPGTATNAIPNFTDLRRIVLLDPAYIGKTQPALPE